MKNKELCKKWFLASKRDKFVPTENSFLCSEHFIKDDYTDTTSKKQTLKSSAIPSIFNFPENFQTNSIPRKPPFKRKFHEIQQECFEEDKNVSTHKYTQADIVSPTTIKLRRQIKTLKQKLKRKEKKL